MRGALIVLLLAGCAPSLGVRTEEPLKYDSLAVARCAAQIEEAVIDTGMPIAQAKVLLSQVLDDVNAGKIPRCGLPPGNSTGR